MDLGLKDRVYVVTGGSRGLGFATAEALVADGARVVVSARGESRVDDAVRLLGDRHPYRCTGCDRGTPHVAIAA